MARVCREGWRLRGGMMAQAVGSDAFSRGPRGKKNRSTGLGAVHPPYRFMAIK
jgi:hypothetical protein